ncbi:MAG: ArsC/Spx/MgsR family protein [Microbacteriaceae bacterium]
MSDPVVWFNPACSKCRTAQGILTEHGADATYLDYLHHPPTRSELRRVLSMIGTDDARTIARIHEPLWAELRLDEVSNDEILAALAEHPALIERPIVIVGDRAVLARPPERVLELLGDPPPA